MSESGKQSESAKQLAAAEQQAKERFERAMTELREGAYRFSSRARGQSELIIEELIDPEGDTVASLAEDGDPGALALAQSLELITFDTWLFGQIGDKDALDLKAEEHWEVWFTFGAWIGETMRLCDGVILTNEFLARRATDFCGLPTWVVPNFLNGAQLDISAQIVERKRASGWRRDIEAVNGFDERMQYGGEDRELGERLEHAGIHGKRVRYQAIVVHLDHDRGYVRPEMIERNRAIRAETRRNRASWTEHGLVKGAKASDVQWPA